MSTRRKAASDFIGDVTVSILETALAVLLICVFPIGALAVILLFLLMATFALLGMPLDLGDIRSYASANLRWLLPALVAAIFVVYYGWAFHQRRAEREREKHTVHRWEFPYNWDEIREQVLARDEHVCGNCGSGEHLHVHHIVPLSLGGTSRPGNLRTLCRDCHARLHPHMRDIIDSAD